MNLRDSLRTVPNYKRSRRAIMEIKQFVARHMKVAERNLDNVKLDSYFNNEMWANGPRNPPTKVSFKAIKEGDIVKVTFVEMPKHVGFAQAKHAKRHKKAEVKAPTAEKKAEEKTEEQKKAEVEKEQSVAVVKEQVAEQQVKAQKHVTKTKDVKVNRMALKK